MSAQHTPGPWTALVDQMRHGRRYGPRMALVTTNTGESVAIDCTGSGKDFDESAANARLIAAAPDLLEALRPFADLDTSTPSELWAIRSELCEAARAAIAKAEGSTA